VLDFPGTQRSRARAVDTLVQELTPFLEVSLPPLWRREHGVLAALVQDAGGPLDLLFVALFAVVAPVIDYLVYWPAFRRRSLTDPAGARRSLWTWGIVGGWTLVAIGAALWIARDRPWKSLGLTVPDGWRLWTSIGLFLLLAAYHLLAVASLARSSEARASLRGQFGTLTALLPHTRTELYRFGGVSLTAGFSEEFLYRGYFVWAFSPWLGWWGAAALSLPFFAVGHLYQGWKGVLRTGVVGALYTGVVALFGSLWPAIALHALLDLGSGTMAWLALREGGGEGGGVEAGPAAEPSAVPGGGSSPAPTAPGTAPDRDGT
jgi:membrane protease YdiL (CAAX protease family)